MAKQEASVDYSDVLEQAALSIYMDLCKGGMRGIDYKVVAQQSFARAKAFAEIATDIRTGGAIPEVAQGEPAPYVEVHLWDAKGNPKYDETGKPTMQTMLGDRYAHAPNLPKEHPINQRYYKALAADKN